jgi:hypothetical protein
VLFGLQDCSSVLLSLVDIEVRKLCRKFDVSVENERALSRREGWKEREDANEGDVVIAALLLLSSLVPWTSRISISIEDTVEKERVLRVGGLTAVAEVAIGLMVVADGGGVSPPKVGAEGAEERIVWPPYELSSSSGMACALRAWP